MTLYDKLNNQINIEHFLNDTMLYVGGEITWPEAYDKYNLTAEENQEQVYSIQFWQDQYELAPSQVEKDIVRLRMVDNLGAAYMACDREAIDEETFLRLIGTTATVEALLRDLPFLAPPPRDETNG